MIIELAELRNVRVGQDLEGVDAVKECVQLLHAAKELHEGSMKMHWHDDECTRMMYLFFLWMT